jgi:hypothetical protein
MQCLTGGERPALQEHRQWPARRQDNAATCADQAAFNDTWHSGMCQAGALSAVSGEEGKPDDPAKDMDAADCLVPAG